MVGTNGIAGDRKKPKSVAAHNHSETHYEVKRWRLDELDFKEWKFNKPESVSRVSKLDNALVRLRKSAPCLAELDLYSQKVYQDASSLQFTLARGGMPDLLAENILHLVTYNAFRGFLSNKETLAQLVIHMIPHQGTAEKINIMDRLPDSAIIVSTKSSIPPCLLPTNLQMQVPHATWIDFIPFPTMRDNLIATQDQFNHEEFTSDVIGNLMAHVVFEKNKTHPKSRSLVAAVRPAQDHEDSDDRVGLILWGEPYLSDSWEATPGFLKKWEWAVAGCTELIHATNRWRATRAEQPILISEI